MNCRRFYQCLVLFPLVLFAMCGCETVGKMPPLVSSSSGAGKTEQAVKIVDSPDGDERQPVFVDSRRLGYVSDRGGNSDIYVLDLARGAEIGATLVTDSLMNDRSPSFSTSESGTFYYSSYREGLGQIFTSSLSGPVSSATFLSRNNGEDNWPSISPDGKLLVYSSRPEDSENFSIWTLNLESGENSLWDVGQGGKWHPDGRSIVYCQERDDVWSIWLLDIVAGTRKRLSNGSSTDFDPCFSPDGRRIAFTCNHGVTSSIWIMNSDGSERRRITTNPEVDCEPTWSPDGSAIYFSSNRGGTFGIYRVSVPN